MKWILVSVLTTLLFNSCSAPGVEGLEVRDAWARPALQGGNGAVYFVIQSSEADEIVGVTSDVAESVEIHESRMNEDVMEMRQLQSVPLGAGEQVMFEPGGFHIMLIGLRQDLQIGDEFAISLRFKDHEDLQINVTVTDSPGAETEH
ncbi:MAG TPA: copper chaperone PCu(A)C [Anaerolineales bacterium]